MFTIGRKKNININIPHINLDNFDAFGEGNVFIKYIELINPIIFLYPIVQKP